MITAHAGRSRRTGRIAVKIVNHTPHVSQKRTADTDQHSWQYHYTRELALELTNNDAARAAELFNRWKSQALADFKRAGVTGDACTTRLLPAIAAIARKYQQIIERITHAAPAKGDTSRDMEVDPYDGSFLTEDDIVREQESTLYVKWIEAQGAKVAKRNAWYIGLGGVVVECKRADVARGRKQNGTGSPRIARNPVLSFC